MAHYEKHLMRLRELLVAAVMCCLPVACTAQPRKPQTKKPIRMEKFNLKFFEERQSGGHMLYTHPDGKVVEQWANDGSEYVEETRLPGTVQTIYKTFYFDTRTVQTEGQLLYKMQTGSWKKYDRSGGVTEVTDYDKPFPFSIADLDKKLRRMGIEILKPSRGLAVLRNVNPQPRYTVTIPTLVAGGMEPRILIIDGRTGQTISDQVVERTK
jgi:hypothetical protein